MRQAYGYRRDAAKGLLLCGLVFGLYATAGAEETAGDIALALAGMPMAEANTPPVCSLNTGQCTTCHTCCANLSAAACAACVSALCAATRPRVNSSAAMIIAERGRRMQTDSSVCALPESGRCTTCPACCKKYSASVQATTDQSESASHQHFSRWSVSVFARLRLATVA